MVIGSRLDFKSAPESVCARPWHPYGFPRAGGTEPHGKAAGEPWHPYGFPRAGGSAPPAPPSTASRGIPTDSPVPGGLPDEPSAPPWPWHPYGFPRAGGGWPQAVGSAVISAKTPRQKSPRNRLIRRLDLGFFLQSHRYPRRRLRAVIRSVACLAAAASGCASALTRPALPIRPHSRSTETPPNRSAWVSTR